MEQSLGLQIRVSLDGKWLAWRPRVSVGDTWVMIPLDGGGARGTVTDQVVEHWHVMVSAQPLLAAWAQEIAFCIGPQPVEACSECMGLTMAADAVRHAAGL